MDHTIEVPAIDVQNSDLAYVLYTSGSTGKPKGVAIEHSSLINLVQYMQEIYPLLENDSYLFKTTYSFDVSVAELFGWFLAGGSLTVLETGTELDSQRMLETIAAKGITHINFVPSMFNVFLETIKEYVTDHLQSLKYIFLAGEELPINLVHKFYELGTHIQLENIYGPTEATIYCAGYSTNGAENNGVIPIGRPLGNMQLYVLSESNEPQPVGVSGELCISGRGLARGYFNDEEQTKEKFVDNPFIPGERMYKTGDLAKWQEDGNIVYLGRIDDQVKIRGLRIELGEITHQLLQSDLIREAATITKGQNEEKYLVAYYTAEAAQDTDLLKRHLQKTLPEYMVPEHYVHLDQLPLTASGKLNRRQLPDPIIEIDRPYTEPANEMELQLTEIWSEVLKLEQDQISVTASFFELGGNSLNAMVLTNKIAKDLQVTVPLKEIFNQQDIRSLGAYISNAEITEYSSIEPAVEKEYYPLSSAQKRMYFLQEFDRDSVTYNMPEFVKFESTLDTFKLENAFKKLIARHESFRTSFEMHNEEPVQYIHETTDFELEEYDAKPEEVDDIIASFIRPFDLSKAPLIRVGLVKVENQEPVLMVDMHHIISDGVSHRILVSEFMKLYDGQELPENKLNYKDYAEWQQSEQQQAALNVQKSFWLNEYSDELTTLELPLDFPRPKIRNYDGDSVGFFLDEIATEKLRTLSKEERSTMFMVILSCYNILLGKLGNLEDIVIGTPTAGRQHADLENMIGMFVNTLSLRNYPVGTLSFDEFLSQVSSRTLSCFENQGYQYEALIDELGVERDISRNALFDAMFVYQHVEEEPLEAPGLTTSSHDGGKQLAKFDITLGVKETKDRLYFDLQYATSLFRKDTIERFTIYLKKVLEAVVSDPSITLSEIDILQEEEKTQLLLDFNDTEVDFPRHETIISLFEQQVERTPDHEAIVHDENQVNYDVLNKKANQLARMLLDNGVERGDVVSIMIGQCSEMVIGILAILKCGGTFLPIDPGYPLARINYLIENSNHRILLSEHNLVTHIGYQKDYIDLRASSYKDFSDKNLKRAGNADDIAYLIYTSGSTGAPKGTMIAHRSLINLCHWHNEQFDINEHDVATKYAGFGFDASVWEIFPYIIRGASIHIIPEDLRLDIKKLNKYYVRCNITISFLPTQVCEQFITLSNNSLRILLTGGDKLNTVEKTSYELVNNYGPTENTVVATSQSSVGMMDNIPIGKPINNTRIYILGQHQELLPLGTVGEICIAGESLARGYLNDPALTTQKFVSNPFVPGTLMYKTGDLGKWLPDGRLVFKGRIDEQVKIRGFRIELGEITQHLLKYPEVEQAVVQLKQDEDEKYIIAHYVSAGPIEIDALKVFLLERLPAYMVPNYYMHVDQMPITANGKVNKKLLPDPVLDINDQYDPPGNDIEKQLVELWAEVLKLAPENISVTKSFFELGGHSLRATKLVNKISQTMQLELPLREIFVTPTVREISKKLDPTKISLSSEYITHLKQFPDTSKNLFFIHDGTGDVHGYLALSGLIENYNCWGLRCDILNRDGPVEVDISEIATTYIERIKQIQPDGAYQLAGWSLGGIIGLEMARQLEAAGENVENLFMIDTVFAKNLSREEELPVNDFPIEDEKLLLKEISDIEVETFNKVTVLGELWQTSIQLIGNGECLEKVKSKIPARYRDMTPNFDTINIEDLLSFVNTIRSLEKAANRYHPDTVLGTQLTYIKASETTYDSHLLHKYFRNKIAFKEIKANHFSIVQDPHVLQVAELLAKKLDEP